LVELSQLVVGIISELACALLLLSLVSGPNEFKQIS
jgi:hypothetical protein